MADPIETSSLDLGVRFPPKDLPDHGADAAMAEAEAAWAALCGLPKSFHDLEL